MNWKRTESRINSGVITLKEYTGLKICDRNVTENIESFRHGTDRLGDITFRQIKWIINKFT